MTVTKWHEEQETAHHEAAHAVVAAALGVPIEWASIDRLYLEDDAPGQCKVDVDMEEVDGPWSAIRATDPETGIRLALVCLAGLAASRQCKARGWPWDEDEARFGRWWSGAFRADDYQRARAHSRFDAGKDGSGVDGSGLGPWDDAFLPAAEELVESLAPAVEAVADELYSALTLSGAEIVALCRSLPGWEQGREAAEAVLARVKAERRKARTRAAGTPEARARGKVAEVDRILREAGALEARHGPTGPWPTDARRRYDALMKRGHRLMDELERGGGGPAPTSSPASPPAPRKRGPTPANNPRIRRSW